ncbi:uncharacterized protein LOC134371845 [Cynocephalus volans]|uniref:uncharacterized protein LOC134371845 n=1 Tax=Cynocephalus volans TaxID=110931 RepID=UPI002FC7894C
MSQRPQSDLQGTQPDFLPAAPNNTQADTQDPLSTTYNPRISTQDPPPVIYGHQVHIQESPQATNSRRVSIQEPPSSTNSRQVSIQEPLSATNSRQVSIQEPLSATGSRRVSIQEPPRATSSRRVNIQEPPPSTYSRWLSVQEPPTSTYSRRVSIQDPLSIIHSRRVSVQEPLPANYSRRVSTEESLPATSSHQISPQERPSATNSCQFIIQGPLPIIHSRRVSIQEPPPAINSHEDSIQDTSSIISTHHFSIHAPPVFQSHLFSNLSSHPLKSATDRSQDNIQNYPPTTQTPHYSGQSPLLQTRDNVDVPPSITHSPEASVESLESLFRSSQESFKECVDSSQPNQSPLDNIHNFSPGSSIWVNSGRFQNKNSHQSLLPICWRLLHEAKKISHRLSLALNIASMIILGLISLGQPWIHFQVPLRPPGDPAGSLTIPISTIFFVECPDISCLHEYDQNAYLLDLSWTFLLFSSIASICLFMALISIIFFTSSNLPMLDFFLFITSILAGTSIILGIMFYLLQAQEFLQEGMTYTLGSSFYLAWTGVFFFLMTGFLSYLNYVNFWSILANHAVWT